MLLQIHLHPHALNNFKYRRYDKSIEKLLFFLTLLNAIFFGIMLNFIDWDVVKKGDNLREELQLPIILFILSIVFFTRYLKILKEEKSK